MTGLASRASWISISKILGNFRDCFGITKYSRMPRGQLFLQRECKRLREAAIRNFTRLFPWLANPSELFNHFIHGVCFENKYTGHSHLHLRFLFRVSVYVQGVIGKDLSPYPRDGFSDKMNNTNTATPLQTLRLTSRLDSEPRAGTDIFLRVCRHSPEVGV